MSRPPAQPIRLSTRVAVGVLLLLPIVGLIMVPVYAHADPQLWGFPFFYWYQLLWVFLASASTYGAYVLIARDRGDR